LEEEASVPNETFFVAPPAHASARRRAVPVSVPEEVFYGEARRPAAETPFAARAAERPLAFGGLLFLLGWLGILAQRSALRQVVVGAPVFEEMAKFGLALAVVSLLGARALLARLPFAWLSGLGFGVLEHFLSYAGEPWHELAIRAAFHAATCGLSMAAFSVLSPLPDVRARWGATLSSSLLHWANNFAAIVVGIGALVAPWAAFVGEVWSGLVVALAFLATIVVVTDRARLERAAAGIVARVFPPLTPAAAEAEASPRSTTEPAAPPPGGTAPEAAPPAEAPPRGPE
jgi:hypothetical protein